MRRFSFFLSSVRSCSFYLNKVGTKIVAKPSRVFHFKENSFFISRQQNSYFSSLKNTDLAPFSSTTKKENEKRKRLKVEIISKENIRPATPTPHNLRIYEASVFDQYFPKNYYMSFVYFYQNNHMNNHEDLISKRRQTLKQSLSEILTRFYPLAGKAHEAYIDCNDEGVYYVEAKVKDRLSEFINQPDNKSIHQLLPFNPLSMELLSQNFVVMVQVTVFGCGGIAIGIYTSHKIIDGYSLITFVKAWAAKAGGFPEQINPSFISPSIFLPIPTLPNSKRIIIDPMSVGRRNFKTTRFLFSASSLKALKEKAGPSSTRVKAVLGLLWKCAIDASRKLRSSTPKHHVMLFPVDMRFRSSPPLPPYSIGNIICITHSLCARDDDAGLPYLVGILKNAVDQVDSEFIEKLKGEEGSRNLMGLLMDDEKVNNKDMEITLLTSLCNGGMYEIDFGWGKPIWVSVGNEEPYVRFMKNMVFLMDTKSGDGIEAWVTLNEEDMTLVEHDAELLSFASLNPSPLETHV